MRARIEYQESQKRFMGFWNKMRRLWPSRMEQLAHELASESRDNIRRIIDEEASDTGRYAASIGTYDESYLKQPNPESSPADAFWHQYKVGNAYVVEFGSNVEYGIAIDLGFSVNESRVIYLDGRFVTVKPYTFAGIHAFDRGFNEAYANRALIDRIFYSSIADIGFS